MVEADEIYMGGKSTKTGHQLGRSVTSNANSRQTISDLFTSANT